MNEKSDSERESSEETERLFDVDPTLDESVAFEQVGGEDQKEGPEAEESRVMDGQENLLITEEAVDLTIDAAVGHAPADKPEETVVVENGPASEGVFIPTNRYNLLEFLSSRLITPRAGIGKYYMDFFENRSGRIPIVSGRMSSSVAEYVAQEDSSAFPVLLELDIESLPDVDVPALGTKGSTATRVADLEAAAFALSGIVPIDLVTAVHFRSGDHLLEHQARRYENVPTVECDLVVSPHLFGGDHLPAEVLKSWLESLEKSGTPSYEDFRAADRVSGALTMIGAALSGDPDELSAFGDLLAGARASKTDSSWPDWIVGGRLSNWSKDRRRKHDADAFLFEAACEAILTVDPRESWRPVEVLETIRSSVLEKGHADIDADRLDQNLLPIKEILRNDREARPFEAGRGMASAKALLLFLLRPEPPRVLSWAGSELAPGLPELIAAAALSGLLWGRQMIGVELREAPMDTYLARRQSHWLSEVARNFDITMQEPGAPELVVDRSPTESVVSLAVDEVPILQRRREHAVSEMLLAANLKESELTQLSRELAEAMSWVDCLTMEYEVKQGDFKIVERPGGVLISIRASAESTPALDVDAFRTSLGEYEIPVDIEGRFRNRIAEALRRIPSQVESQSEPG